MICGLSVVCLRQCLAVTSSEQVPKEIIKKYYDDKTKRLRIKIIIYRYIHESEILETFLINVIH